MVKIKDSKLLEFSRIWNILGIITEFLKMGKFVLLKLSAYFKKYIKC